MIWQGTIDRLQADNARMRAALERIACLAGEFEGPDDPAEALLACEVEANRAIEGGKARADTERALRGEVERLRNEIRRAVSAMAEGWHYGAVVCILLNALKGKSST